MRSRSQRSYKVTSFYINTPLNRLLFHLSPINPLKRENVPGIKQKKCGIKQTDIQQKKSGRGYSLARSALAHDVCIPHFSTVRSLCTSHVRKWSEGVKQRANVICTLTALAPSLIKMGASTYSKQMLSLSLACTERKPNWPLH